MTSRERNLAILHGEVPDCVPCAPDISNMVPARLTGRPFYHIYAYQDPPLWKAHIDALKVFDIDGGFELYSHSWAVVDPPTGTSDREERIVKRNPDGSFATRGFQLSSGCWDRFCTAYPADNPPFGHCRPKSLGVPEVPSEWEPLTGVKQWPVGDELWQLIRREMGDQGIVGLYIGASTCVLGCEDDVYAYYDNPEPFRAIDDAAAGGGFILSTGDQCGRDTPDANLRAMIETARTYGRY